MKIVLIGIVGAGKSTQGNLLSRQLRIPYLSTGHIFRRLSNEKTQPGRYIKETMSAGLLIPDDKTLDIVGEYLKRSEYKNGYILDGFPRTLIQAKHFSNGIDKVIYIELPDKEALWRIAAYRNGNQIRNDDTINALKKRIDIFHKVVTPVIYYYQKKGNLVIVDGTGSINEVNKQILKALGKQIVNNKLKNWERSTKTIIAVVGLQGSGKSEATNYFKNKCLPVITFGAMINKYIDDQKMTHTVKIHKQIRMRLRNQHGMAALAILNKEKVKKAFKQSSIIVIDGLRSYEEKHYLETQFPGIEIKIIAIWAPYDVRMHRIRIRRKRHSLSGHERDIDEVIDANMGPTIALTDYLIINDSSLDEFYYKLENIYRELYYS